ncbi:hypothetical protein B0H34DRAFT_653570 [Crassisporium funariophilum]|nr:hypothetical protein B0H34DRAFT_653570 [Crassisporium funariophilum]
MAPSRTHDRQQNTEASASKPDSRPKHRKQKHEAPIEPSSALGVQKVKALLRQTRRLLAKDNLAADVRVETERRQRALGYELSQAEQTNKERALAVRYHKIKFFERQKVTRKLKQAKKRLESTNEPSEKEAILSEITKLRIDLNYILHFPKSKKYISLFPPEVRKGAEAVTSTDPTSDSQKTITDREEVREWILEQMTKGELFAEPELNLDTRSSVSKQRTWTKDEVSHTTKAEAAPVDDLKQDAFFGEDDEDAQ